MTSDEREARNARIRYLSGRGWSVRQIAREERVSRSQVHRVLMVPAEIVTDDDRDPLGVAEDESELALLDAADDYAAVPPFRFVGMERVRLDRGRGEEPVWRDEERFVDGGGRSVNMAEIYRCDFADGSVDKGYMADAAQQVQAAGYVKVSDGTGYWHWERAG